MLAPASSRPTPHPLFVPTDGQHRLGKSISGAVVYTAENYYAIMYTLTHLTHSSQHTCQPASQPVRGADAPSVHVSILRAQSQQQELIYVPGIYVTPK